MSANTHIFVLSNLMIRNQDEISGRFQIGNNHRATTEESSGAGSTDKVRQGLKTLNYQNYADKTIDQLPHAE